MFTKAGFYVPAVEASSGASIPDAGNLTNSLVTSLWRKLVEASLGPVTPSFAQIMGRELVQISIIAGTISLRRIPWELVVAKERWFTVELRCGTCGAIFCASRTAVLEHKVVEYVDMFLARGPGYFVQCKNQCSRVSQDPLKPNNPKIFGNQNQKIVTAEFFPKEHGYH